MADLHAIVDGAMDEPHPTFFTTFQKDFMHSQGDSLPPLPGSVQPFSKAVNKLGWGSAMALFKGQEVLPSSKVQCTMRGNFCLEEEGPAEMAAERVLVWAHLYQTGVPN